MNRDRNEGMGYILVAGILAILVSTLLAGALSPAMTQAAPPISPLPSRPAPVADEDDEEDDDDEDDEPVGAHIELQVQSAPSGVWTMVQWQNSAGIWHDVKGWRGTLDEAGKRVWWVAWTDFGKGPFRWAVYQSPDGDLLAESESFYLPNSAGETITIKVSPVR